MEVLYLMALVTITMSAFSFFVIFGISPSRHKKNKYYQVFKIVFILLTIVAIIFLNLSISQETYRELDNWKELIPVLESANQDIEWVQKTKIEYNSWFIKNKESLDKFGWASFVPEEVNNMDILKIGYKE